MSQPLPTGGFRWITPDEIAERSDKGYLLEVDVKYPRELHDLHNDLLFMCEKMEINGGKKSWFLTYTTKRIMSFT